MTMEQLSIESFSYSWQINLKKPSSIDTLDDPFAPYFDQTDPPQDFDFDFTLPTSPQPLALMHADQIFSNGLLLPLHLISSTPSPQRTDTTTTSTTTTLESFSIKRALSSDDSSSIPERQSPLFYKCKKSSWRLFHKYLGFFRPLCRKVKRLRLAQRRVGSSSTTPSMGVTESVHGSPRVSWTHSSNSDTWYHRNNKVLDANIENAIYEAVLYCKKSIEKQDVGSEKIREKR